MKCHLLYLSYNNYFNRIIKKELSSVEEYLAYPHALRENVSFNPNDGIETSIVVNWLEENFIPDYCIVISLEGSILSKWFITDFVRTRAGQFNVSLKRDVISDHYEEVINAPCFVEKGFVNETNPLIFNKEDFSCNQIKKDEDVICDKSYSAWLVVYYNLSKKAELSGDVSTTSKIAVEIGTTLDNFPIYAYHDDSYKLVNTKKYSVTWKTPLGEHSWAKTKMIFNENSIAIEQNGSTSFVEPSDVSLKSEESISVASQKVNEYLEDRSDIKYQLGLYGEPTTSFDDLFKWNGVLIKTSDNKYYRIRIENEGSFNDETALNTGALFNTISAYFKSGGVLKTGWTGDLTKTFSVILNTTYYKVYADEEKEDIKSYHYDFTSAPSLVDGAYGIIAFPFDNKYRTKNVWKGISRLDLDIGILIAKDMCASGVGADKKVFDVQILPYCPIELPSTIDANGGTVLNFNNVNSNLYTEIKDGSDNIKSVAIHPLTCRRTEYINYKTWMLNQFYFARGRYAYKVENQCTFYRLVSPNFNGQFEFNRAKNNNFNTFRMDITYKPYQPYIHIAPVFNGLYGDDFGDARGLICGGDFSFGVTSNAFEQYKMQNKNYQDIFNRQIENMDTNYNINQKYGLISTIEKEVASAAALIGGGVMGHPAAALGGGVGLVGSAATGITNYFKNKETHQEARDYAIDIHNYQLDNVKALPDSLAKVDAYNNNNKLFPILEKYSCTDEEIQIFNDKLKYEGMTINALGKIKDYIDEMEERSFVKGKIIRIDELGEDSHLLYVICDEIAKGVYLNGRE